MIKIIEAIRKPSELMKRKDNSVKRRVTYSGGDVYDTVSGTYDEDVKYADYDYEGYIYDKEGNKYNFVANLTTSDAGRIVGGATDYYVTIFYNNTKLSWHGYTAVFSSSYYTDIIDDLAKGFYLEDYCAKYPNARSGEDIVKSLSENGDANPPDYRVTAKNKDSSSYLQVIDRKRINLSVLVDNIFTCKCDIDSDIDNNIQNAVVKTKYIQEYFSKSLFRNGYDYSDFKGSILSVTINNIGEDFVITKSGELKCRCFDKYKNGNIKGFVLKDVSIKIKYIDLRNCEFMEKLNKVIAKYRRQHKDEEIKATADRNYDKNRYSDDYYYRYGGGYLQGRRTRDYYRRDAKMNYSADTQLLLNGQLDFETFVLYINRMPEKQLNAAVKTFVTDDTDNTVEVKLSSIKGIATTQDCYDKMLAWHNGERGLNIKAANVDKLATYYRICKEKGYDDKANELSKALGEKGVIVDEGYNRNIRHKRLSL